MHGCGYAGFFEVFLHPLSVGQLHSVLGPGAGVVGFYIGRLDGWDGLPRFARNDGFK